MQKRSWRKGVYQSTTLVAVALLLLILFVSVGYFFLIPQTEQSQANTAMLRRMQLNKAKWENNKPLSFRYVVRRSCYCEAEAVTPYVATEERGVKTAVFRIEVESASGEFLSSPPNPVWIADIYAELADAIASAEAPLIEVSYDGKLGYPATVNIRYPMPDAYVRYDIQDFELIEHH
jgi:hypothetical protein